MSNTIATIKGIESKYNTFAKVTLTIDGKDELVDLHFSDRGYKIKTNDKIVIEFSQNGNKKEAKYKGRMCNNRGKTYHGRFSGHFSYDSQGNPCLIIIKGDIISLQMIDYEKISSFEKNDNIEIKADCNLEDKIVGCNYIYNSTKGYQIERNTSSCKTSFKKSKLSKNRIKNQVVKVKHVRRTKFGVEASFYNEKTANIHIDNLPYDLKRNDTIVYTYDKDKARYLGKQSSPTRYVQQYKGQVFTVNELYALKGENDHCFYPPWKEMLDEAKATVGDIVVVELERNIRDNQLVDWNRGKNISTGLIFSNGQKSK